MTNLSDAARSPGDVMYRLAQLEREVQQLQTARRLEAASVGRGGLRLVGGDIIVDENGEIVVRGGRIIAGDPEGSRAEITPLGYRLINADGEADIDLTTEGAANLIRLRGTGSSAGEVQSNEILLTSDGQMNGRVLAVDEIKLDGQDLTAVLTSIWNAIRQDAESKPNPDPPPAAGTITRTYTAQWTELYDGSNNRNTFLSGLAQGFYSGTNGNQKSLIRFPSSTIAADHAGRTVTRVRVYLYFDHWYFNSGGTAILGHHTQGTSPPSSFVANTNEVQSANWPKPGGRWVQYHVGNLNDWVTGAKTGISIGPGPTGSRLYYGRAREKGEPGEPRLEIRSTA